MTASELIGLLQDYDPDTTVLIEVDGGATRTGSYLNCDIRALSVYPVSYGGYEEAPKGSGPGDEQDGEFMALVIS